MKHRGIKATVCGVFFCIFGKGAHSRESNPATPVCRWTGSAAEVCEQHSHFGNCAGDGCGMGPAMGVPFAARAGGGLRASRRGDELLHMIW
jgi:hypothetical protein